jgi:hypothetical protein
VSNPKQLPKLKVYYSRYVSQFFRWLHALPTDNATDIHDRTRCIHSFEKTSTRLPSVATSHRMPLDRAAADIACGLRQMTLSIRLVAALLAFDQLWNKPRSCRSLPICVCNSVD